MRSSVAAAGAGCTLAVAALLSGCGAASPVEPASLIGQTLEVLSQGPGAEATLLVQDASPRIGEAPAYDGDPDRDAAWVIVAICTSDDDVAASSDIEVAVLPTSSMTAAVTGDIAAGRYRDAVGCEGRPFRG